MLFHLFLTFALIRRLNRKGNGTQEQKPIVDLAKGSKAPDFTAQNLKGETVTLADFTGRKLALVFIASHCKPCQELLPKLMTLKEKLLHADIEIMLVSTEERNTTKRYVEEHAISLPVLIAPRKTNTLLDDYTISGTPAFCFITAQGTIRDAGVAHFEGERWPLFEDFLAAKVNAIEAKGGDTEKVGSH